MSGDSFVRRVDKDGTTYFAPEDAFDLLYRGYDVSKLIFDRSSEVDRYNELCRKYNKPDYCISSTPPEITLAERLSHWFLSEEFRHLDVRSEVLARCVSDDEQKRVNEEMDIYESRGLLDLLRLMFMLVDHFRKSGIVWGVGRGSSVASYVLFLIGVHKIDSLFYGLSIDEFLRD